MGMDGLLYLRPQTLARVYHEATFQVSSTLPLCVTYWGLYDLFAIFYVFMCIYPRL